MLQHLRAQPDDGLLTLINLFNADPRPAKLDLGVGMFRDDNGETPVFRAVKAAEQQLLETQRSKGYLGPAGDGRFVELLADIAFNGTLAAQSRFMGVQTPGGGGALRLGAELLAAAKPGATIWIGEPTWPNHHPVFAAVGLQARNFRYFDMQKQQLCFDTMMDQLEDAVAGDILLLQACCHNPTGADLDGEQWRVLTDYVLQRGLVPFIDFAYQGLGRGLQADALGVCYMLSRIPEALIAYSCDKNFGLYRERTGALFVLAQTPAIARVAFANMSALARVNWSMPPDHGAAVVRIVLETPILHQDWRKELSSMQQRIGHVREALAFADPRLACLAKQRGMFSQLSIGPHIAAQLRSDHAIYIPGSGRLNLAGLRVRDVHMFVDRLNLAGGMPALNDSIVVKATA